MTEVWLRSNRRVLTLALLPAGLLGGLGSLVFFLADPDWLRFLAGAIVSLAVFLMLGLIHQLLRPRVAYRNGQVLFYLKAGSPIEVPVEVVEAFIFGQGLVMLPSWMTTPEEVETVNLIARLSQRATQWRQMETKRALGRWEDSYVVIRGTWCEPLTGDLIRRLNRRLAEATQAWNDASMDSGGSRS